MYRSFASKTLHEAFVLKRQTFRLSTKCKLNNHGENKNFIDQLESTLKQNKDRIQFIDLKNANLSFAELKQILYIIRSIHFPFLVDFKLPCPTKISYHNFEEKKQLERIYRNAKKSMLNRQRLNSKIEFSMQKRIQGRVNSQRINVTDEDQNIVIVGLGPIGLAATLAAIQAHDGKKKTKIVALYDRTEYTRGQILRLDKSQLEYLKSLLGNRVINHLKATHQLEKEQMNNLKFWVIKTKTLEKVLRTAVDAAQKERPDLLELVQVRRTKLNDGTQLNSFDFNEDKKSITLHLENSK